MKTIAQIYRSTKKEGAYLYVVKGKDLNELPEALTKLFGKPKLAMTLVLTPERKLAHTTVEKVLQACAENGYYLQLPPRPDSDMQALAQLNSKL